VGGCIRDRDQLKGDSTAVGIGGGKGLLASGDLVVEPATGGIRLAPRPQRRDDGDAGE
jgi:hypothetical protein